MEVRLIDANKLKKVFEKWWDEMELDSIKACIFELNEQPTIDPETLPIVRELREKLERVTAERDAALKQLSDISDCDTCKHTECIPRGGRGKCKWEWNSGAGDHP